MKKMIDIYCLGKYDMTFQEYCEYEFISSTKEEKDYYIKRLKNEIIEKLKERGFIKEEGENNGIRK